jgi:hypothetical protein
MAVPGCQGGDADPSKTNFCIDPINLEKSEPENMNQQTSRQKRSLLPLTSFGGNPSADRFPLKRCQGDCDDDSMVSYVQNDALSNYTVRTLLQSMLMDDFLLRDT